MEKIKFRELVELFLNKSFQDIKSEVETPNINFKFGEDGFTLFESIVEEPFVKEGYWTPDAQKSDIDFIRLHNNDDVPTIQVNDSIKFFEYLTDIVNSLMDLSLDYGIATSERNLTMHIFRRIWLRMGIEDIANVEEFLDRQLQFLRNRLLDTPKEKNISSFDGYDVSMKTEVNQTWYETTRSMIFTMRKNDSSYELPHILYDIDDNGICYIYAVQSSKKENDKHIERSLYRLNKNIENPNVHPSKVYAMILFINELKKKGITKIRIPSMQVLSYRYHELLSPKGKEELEKAEKELEKYPDDLFIQRKYKHAKKWFESTYENEDKISYLKTEELIYLAYRMLEHDEDIEIINDVNLQGDYLGIKIKTK